MGCDCRLPSTLLSSSSSPAEQSAECPEVTDPTDRFDPIDELLWEFTRLIKPPVRNGAAIWIKFTTTNNYMRKSNVV
jgi:hypothetical protein